MFAGYSAAFFAAASLSAAASCLAFETAYLVCAAALRSAWVGAFPSGHGTAAGHHERSAFALNQADALVRLSALQPCPASRRMNVLSFIGPNTFLLRVRSVMRSADALAWANSSNSVRAYITRYLRKKFSGVKSERFPLRETGMRAIPFARDATLKLREPDALE